jgi:hypothetical protein
MNKKILVNGFDKGLTTNLKRRHDLSTPKYPISNLEQIVTIEKNINNKSFGAVSSSYQTCKLFSFYKANRNQIILMSLSCGKFQDTNPLTEAPLEKATVLNKV